MEKASRSSELNAGGLRRLKPPLRKALGLVVRGVLLMLGGEESVRTEDVGVWGASGGARGDGERGGNRMFT